MSRKTIRLGAIALATLPVFAWGVDAPPLAELGSAVDARMLELQPPSTTRAERRERRFLGKAGDRIAAYDGTNDVDGLKALVRTAKFIQRSRTKNPAVVMRTGDLSALVDGSVDEVILALDHFEDCDSLDDYLTDIVIDALARREAKGSEAIDRGRQIFDARPGKGLRLMATGLTKLRKVEAAFAAAEDQAGIDCNTQGQ